MHDTSTPPPTPRSARILIIDADPRARDALSDAVGGLGFALCGATEPGPSALDIVRRSSPDLVLAGLGAGASAAALETAERIGEQLGVPIVFAAETIDAALLQRAQRAGPHGYVPKSADARQLGLAIEAALSAAARQVARGERSAALFRSLFDSMTEAVVAADNQGRIMAVSPAAKRIVESDAEWDPADWEEYYEVYGPDGRTPLPPEKQPLTRALRGETTADFVFLLRPREEGADDIRLAASGYPLLDPHGRRVGGAVLLRAATDAAEQSARVKQFEAELHERVQVLDAIIRSMSDGVVVADAQGRLTLFNPAAVRIIGVGITSRPPDEWPDHYGLFHADGLTRVPADELPLVRAVRGETVEDMEIFVRNERIPEGTYISVNASPVRDEARNAVGGVAVFRDVSERKLEQEALTQAFAHGRLEVIDTVLHNIGNAINSVATGVDTLNGQYADNELHRRFNALANLVRQHDDDWTAWLADDPQGRQVRPFLISLVRNLNREQENLRSIAARVRERVRHIVDIIRTQASFTGGTVERKSINLREAVDNAVRVVQESFGRRGGAIQVDCTLAPDRILVQESRFQQMLVNLLKNALEATDERAALPRNDPEWKPRIRVLACRAEREGFLVIDVVDNGIGIDPARFRSLFNPGHTTKKAGNGLGLHSAANFVIASGGSIEPLSDGIGRGTTMRVTLRVAGQPAAGTGGDE